MEVAVIGGGAAGFFSAISVKHHHPAAKVTLFEKSNKLLSKVKISGGGRCNVTHHCFDITELIKFYPRGARQLRKVFGEFSPKDTVEWFKNRGIELKAEADGRMFPVTDSSQTIIDCLVEETRKKRIRIDLKSSIEHLIPTETGIKLVFKTGDEKTVDKVIVATGGSPREGGLNWIKNLGHRIESPVPSLFTFNMPKNPIVELMGVVANPVNIKIMGSKLKSEGPLLITHWGMSGPAVLKLSAFGARELNAMNYNFSALINWLGNEPEHLVRERLIKESQINNKKKVQNTNPFNLANRLWLFLLEKIEIGNDMIWENMGKKNINRLAHLLTSDEYAVSGKTTFKEEFVTCGGVSLKDVDFKSMQSKKVPGLYFAGEVLDIDGVTGGFNFQAAWTTGFIAGKLRDN